MWLAFHSLRPLPLFVLMRPSAPSLVSFTFFVRPSAVIRYMRVNLGIPCWSGVRFFFRERERERENVHDYGVPV